MQVQYDTTPRLSVVITFSDEEKKYLKNKFLEMCAPAMTGDKKLFDDFCEKIPAFCEEIYQMGKDMDWPPGHNDEPRIDTPNDCVIYSVGSNIGCVLIRFFHCNYAAKSEALHKMVCDVISEEKYAIGRYSFITCVWPKTKRTDGIDIPKLLNSDPICGCNTVDALLKLRDGRFVKEVRKLQERLPKDTWIAYKKKIALYIERYGK